jgi:hypothetical protein
MGFGNLFGKLAVKSVNNRCIAIIFAVLITSVFALGIIGLKMESDP